MTDFPHELSPYETVPGRVYTAPSAIKRSEAKRRQSDVPKRDRRRDCVAGEIGRWGAPGSIEGSPCMPSSRVRWSLGRVGWPGCSRGWIVGDNRMPSWGKGTRGYEAAMHRQTWGGWGGFTGVMCQYISMFVIL